MQLTTFSLIAGFSALALAIDVKLCDDSNLSSNCSTDTAVKLDSRDCKVITDPHGKVGSSVGLIGVNDGQSLCFMPFINKDCTTAVLTGVAILGDKLSQDGTPEALQYQQGPIVNTAASGDAQWQAYAIWDRTDFPCDGVYRGSPDPSTGVPR